MFIVEGPMDMIMSWQDGVRNVVATMGTALTSDHMKIIERHADTCIMSFDNDPAGSAAGEKALDLAAAHDINAEVCTIRDYKDPADLVANKPGALHEFVAHTKPAIEFYFEKYLGKGHEKTMCYGIYEHPWSDQKFIGNLLSGYDDLSGIILAAGKGTRMKSRLPKAVHTICGRPMISFSLENLRNAGIINLIPVVGFNRHLVLREISRNLNFVIQRKTLGTGNAVKIALAKIDDKNKHVLVINADDSAFYKPETIKKVIETHKQNNSVITFVSLIQDDPTGLGRVVRNKDGGLKAIIEEKDADNQQKKIKEVNDGLYIFNQKWLRKNINNLVKSPMTGEYYLTDLLKLAIDQEEKISIYKLPNSNEWQGINNPDQLHVAEEKMKMRLKETLNK